MSDSVEILDDERHGLDAVDLGDDEAQVVAAVRALTDTEPDTWRFQRVSVSMSHLGGGPQRPAWWFLSGDEDDADDDHYTEQIAAAYRAGDRVAPVLVDPDGRLIDGYHRRAAAQLAGRERLEAWRLTAAAR